MRKNFKVTMTFQFPAWDEVNGIEYLMTGNTKADAVKSARRQAENDGHAVGGRGKYWFRAVETDEAPQTYESESLIDWDSNENAWWK